MIKIVDNLTTPANVKFLQELMIEMPWFYLESTAYNFQDSKRAPYDPSWVSMIFNQGEIKNPIMSLLHSLLINALYKEGLTIRKLIRIRAGLMTRTPSTIVHDPHVDWDDEHMTALYYVNDSDGDTIFYNQTRNPKSESDSFQEIKDTKFTIAQTVQPRADRMVIFNGNIYHSSSSPVLHDTRIVINYNWLS